MDKIKNDKNKIIQYLYYTYQLYNINIMGTDITNKYIKTLQNHNRWTSMSHTANNNFEPTFSRTYINIDCMI